MWVFDGETWTEDGGEEVARKSGETRRAEEFVVEFVAELQVVEILPSKIGQVPPPSFP